MSAVEFYQKNPALPRPTIRIAFTPDEEVGRGTDPLDPIDDPCLIITDCDGDGITNELEEQLGTDPYDPDSDDDGLNDGDEVNVHGTDPLDSDSDDDGLNDGDEVNVHGTDPLNADSDGDLLDDGTERTSQSVVDLLICTDPAFRRQGPPATDQPTYPGSGCLRGWCGYLSAKANDHARW